MLAPLLLASLASGCQLTLRLVLEPYGERVFDELGSRLESGAFGLPIRLHEFVRLDAQTTIYLIASDRPDRHFGRVFLRQGRDVFSATSANAYRDVSGRIEVELFDGRQVAPNNDGGERVLDFATLRFAFSPSAAAEQMLPSGDRLNRLPFGSLLGSALRETSADTDFHPITASLLACISNGLFCLLLPWLAYVLAQPPARERSGAGIAGGIGALVLFLRTNAVVETHFTHWPIAAAAAHLGLWAGVTAALVCFDKTHDEGFIDHAVNTAYRKFVSI